MATLQVPATTDYRGTALTNINKIEFTGGAFATAIFASDQFGTGLISPSVHVVASAFGSEFRVMLSTAGGTFDGSAMTFENWNRGLMSIYGAQGSDNIIGTSEHDTINAGLGADTVHGGDGDDSIITDGNQGPDVLIGGDGVDQVLVNRSTGTIDYLIDISKGGLGNDIGDGTTLAEFELVAGYGGSGNDTIIGGDNNDILEGGSGDDFLKGGNGRDTFRGGDGDDTINSKSFTGGCTYDGGAGSDLLVLTRTGSLIDFTLDLGAGSSDIGDGSSVEANFERLTFRGGSGNDTITGRNLNDRLTGSLGDDTLSGRNGNDRLFGDAGRDTLTGGAGRDILTGGTSADIFVFSNVSHSQAGSLRDVVQDFKQGTDTVDLTGIGGLTFTGSNNFSGAAGEIIVKHTATKTVVKVDVDGDTVSDMDISFVGLIAFQAGDFLV